MLANMTSFLRKFKLKTIFPFFGLIGVIILFQFISDGRLLSPNNIKTLVNESFMIMIVAVGYAFLMSQGEIDFSVGSAMAVSCAAGALAAKVLPILSLPAGIFAGVLIGCLNGWLVVRLRIQSLVATLSTQFFLSGLVVLILDGGVFAAPLKMLKWNTLVLKLPVLFGILIIGYIIFEYTAFGKRGRAIGSCREAARQSGININLIRFIPFVITGGLVGLLSFFSLIRTGTASSQTGSELFMNVLTAVLLGGMPISGGASSKYRVVVIGSLTMAVLTNGMTMMGLGIYDRQLIKGAVFLIAIAVSFDRKNMKIIK